MSATSNCPNCTQPVTIPDGLDPTAVVRCPTCEAEYPLSEALAGVSEEEQATSDTMAFLRSLEGAEPGSGTADVAPPELVPVAAISEDAQPAEPDQQAEEAEVVVAEVVDEPEPEPEEGPAADEGPIDVEVMDEPPAQADEPPDEAAGGERIVEALDEPPAGEDGAEPGVSGTEPGAEEPDDLTIEPEDSLNIQPEDVGEVKEEEEPQETEATQEEEATQKGGEEQEAKAAQEAEIVEEAEEEAKEAEEPAPVDLDPLVRGPHGDAEFRLSELTVVSTGEPLGPVTAGVIAKRGLLRALTEEEAEAAAKEAPGPDMWGKVEAAPQLDLGFGAGAEAADHGEFAIQHEGTGEARPARTMPVRPRRKGKEKSAFRTIAEIVLGAIVAIPCAAYLAVLIKGDQANFLKSPLPGFPSTYHHAPEWWPQWLKIGAAEDETASEGDSDSATAGEKGDAQASKPAEKPKGKDPFATGPEAKQPPESPQEKPVKPPAKKKPSAKKKPKPAARPVAPLGRPSFNSDQLGEALAALNVAFGCENCNSTGKVTKTVTEVQEIGGKKKEVKKEVTVECEVCHGKPPREMNDAAYDAFCQTSRVVTFVEGADGQLASRKRAVRDLAEKAGEGEGGLAKIGGLAAARLDDEGRLEAGLFLAGTVEQTGPQGALHVSKILLTGSDKAVTVVSPRSLPAAAKDQVLVLGSIVEEPTNKLPGYQGPESVVVWAGECVKVK